MSDSPDALTYEGNSRTMEGGKHPGSATSQLTAAAMEVLPDHSKNPWLASEATVKRADDELCRLAAEHLVALRIFGLQDDEPQVAMRNVKVGDYVRLHGTTSYVHEVIDRRADGSNPQSMTVTLRVKYHGPDNDAGDTYTYDRDVTIPLVARDREAS